MMGKFSAREALFSGIGLMRREPRLLLSLAVVYLLSGVLPQLLAYWAVWPELITALDAAARSALTGGKAGEVPEMAQMQARMLPYQLLAFPFSVAGMLMIYGAINRAILRPQDRGFGYLRLGRREGALFLTSLVAILLLIVAAMAAALVIVILVMGVRMAAGPDSSATGLATFGLILVAVILGGWCAIRLSLAYPMAFADGQFRLFESWALTRGQGWKIFGVQLAMIAIVIGLELAVALVVILVAIAIGIGVSGHADAIAQAMTAKMAQGAETWAPQFAVAYLCVMAVTSAIVAGFYMFVTAPIADIYRQLTAGSADPG